jgi:hypothetical protein
MEITIKTETDADRLYREQEELFCAKCAEKAARLDDDDRDTPAAIRSAQEVVAELAAVGIKRGLSRARDEIDHILKSRSDEDGNA